MLGFFVALFPKDLPFFSNTLNLVGDIPITPLKNDGVRQLGYYSQLNGKKYIDFFNMFIPTYIYKWLIDISQHIYIYNMFHTTNQGYINPPGFSPWCACTATWEKWGSAAMPVPMAVPPRFEVQNLRWLIDVPLVSIGKDIINGWYIWYSNYSKDIG